ncbi:MAG: glycosyltransferase family 39 protein [Anaerolineales bacterium]|nr:glycosyltransferase family 39 protein [Anaerolineales bacterium]
MLKRLPTVSRTVWLLGLFALLAYLPGSWWGAPHATAEERKQSWGVDDETPLGPLAEIHNIIEPKPDRNLGYPLMYSFVVAAAYAPYLGFLFLTGQWTTISGAYPFGFADPVATLKVMTYIAHLVTVLMGVGLVLAAYETGRVLWNRRAGILTALFALSSYPLFYYARNGNVDVPMLFFVALTIMMFAHCLAGGVTTRRLFWLGVFGGFALGTKEQAVAAFLIIPFVLLALQWRAHDGRWRSRAFWAAPAAGLLGGVLAFGFGSGLFVEPSRYIAHVQLISGRVDTIAAGDIYIPNIFPNTLSGNLQYLQKIGAFLVDMMTLPGLILGLAGLAGLIWRHPRKSWVGLTAVSYLLFIFLTLRAAQMRYLMPGAFLLAFPAGWLLAVGWESRHTAVRWGSALLAVGIVGFGLLRGAALTYEMINDSRFAAAAWLAPRLDAGDSVEYFGPVQNLPPLEAGVLTTMATEYFGIYVPTPKDDAKVREILQGWDTRQPEFIILLPDLTSPPGVHYNSSCPPQLCDAMLDGSLGFPLAARFQTEPLFPWLPLPELDYPSVNPPIYVFARPSADTAVTPTAP